MNTSSRVYSYAQRGMATLAILILVGFAVSVAVFGALRFLQGSQSQTTAYHSQTQAQMKAWAGVDLVSQYLSGASVQLDSSGKFNSLLTALLTQNNILGQLNDPSLRAVITDISPAVYDPKIEHYKVTANITGLSNVDTRAAATSTVEVIYQLAVTKSEVTPTQPPGNNVISFHDDVDLTGGISIKGQSQETYEIVVKGNVKLGSIGLDQNLDGLSISSTGSIEFTSGGGINLKKLHANCDIKLTSGPSATEILATNNICISGSQDSPNNIIKANGSVNLKGKYGDIEASANKPVNTAMCDVAAIRKCDDVIKVVGVEIGDGSTVKTIKTKGNLKTSSTTTADINAEGDVEGSKQFGRINSGGNVLFTNSTSVGDISSYGSVTSTNTVAYNNIFAGGSITLGNTANGKDIISGGSISTRGGTFGNATAIGQVTFTNGGSLGNIISGGSVSTKNASGKNIMSGGSVSTDGGTFGDITAREQITFNSGGSGKTLISGGSVSTNGGTFGDITAREQITFNNGGSGGAIWTGKGLALGKGRVGYVKVKDNLVVDWDNSVTGGEVGGSYTHKDLASCKPSDPEWQHCFGRGKNSHNLNVKTGVNVSIPPMPSMPSILPPVILPKTREEYLVNLTPVPPVVIKQTIFSVDIYRSIANYVFYRSGNNNMVLVQDVTGIPNGRYYLHQGQVVGAPNGSAPYNDWLCSKPIGQATAADCIAKIGRGFDSTQNTLISYSDGKWTLNGSNLAPGIAYFEGDLALGSGTYYNTFISTNNITVTDGQFVVKSPNYVGYQGICNNANYVVKPTSFCSNNTYNSNAYSSIGNFALMAGVCTARNGDQCTAYTGGDITTGSSTTVEGSILAGNRFFSGGNTVVKGYVTAFVQRTPTSGSSLGGSTAIDVSNLPSTYIPSGNAPSVDGSGNGAASFSVSSSVLWARYL